MDSLFVVLVVAFTGVVVLPLLAVKLKTPVIILELIFGILIGKSLLNVVPDHLVIEFLSSFGLTYLMFLAGMETDIGRIRWVILKKVLIISLASVIVPLIFGFILAHLVDMHPLLLGTIMSTTSIGLVLPVLREVKLSPRYSQMLLVSAVIVDIISMFLLAFVLGIVQDTLGIGYLYSVIAIGALFVIPWVINKRHWRRKVSRRLLKYKSLDIEMRLAFAIIVLFGTISLQLGFHTIIGAFIAGLLVSEILPRRTLDEERLQSFGYSFFIPLFFIFTGAKVNLGPVFSGLDNIVTLLLVVAAGLLSKVLGVTVAAKLSGLKTKLSLAFGMFHMARLSLIIAAADIALELGDIDESAFAIFIVLAIVSAIVAPLAGKYVLSRPK